VLAASAEGVTVACGEGAVTLTALQREGRRPLPAEAFLRGLALPETLG
jgi:methionyl-tRNA formyltransferase